MDRLGDFSKPLKCWSFFWRQERTAGPMDREWPSVFRIHPIKAMGGASCPRHLSAQGGNPPTGSAEVTGPCRLSDADGHMTAALAANGPAKAGSFHLGKVRNLGSGAHRGSAGGELLLGRMSCAASKTACDPNLWAWRRLLRPCASCALATMVVAAERGGRIPLPGLSFRATLPRVQQRLAPEPQSARGRHRVGAHRCSAGQQHHGSALDPGEQERRTRASTWHAHSRRSRPV